jgi:hypothetical protein
MKKLSLVAVAVCLCVGASFASYDKFGVIGDGSAEAKFGVYGGDWDLNVRYGLLENLELFSRIGTNASDYTVGARYQIIPVLGGFLDLDLPTMRGSFGSHNFGLTPGINFTTNFTDALSFGSVAQLAVELADPDPVLDLKVGVEVDYMFSDNVGAWVGVDFVYDRLTQENREDLDIAAAIQPGIGFFFTKDALTVGTMLSLINLKHTNADGEDSIGIQGGVEVAIKF